MQTGLDFYQTDKSEKIQIPTEHQVRRIPSFANIASLDAALSSTRIAIIANNPSVQELMDLIDYGEEVPDHLFNAHNIIDGIERLRLTIRLFIKQVEQHQRKKSHTEIPF